jgi:hypothetical protein
MMRRSKKSGHPEARPVVQSDDADQRLIDDADQIKTLHILRKSLEESRRAEARDAREVLHEIASKYGIALGK